MTDKQSSMYKELKNILYRLKCLVAEYDPEFVSVWFSRESNSGHAHTNAVSSTGEENPEYIFVTVPTGTEDVEEETKYHADTL